MANGFKSALFGFKKKDVIAYLEQINADYCAGISKAESYSTEIEKRNTALADENKTLSCRCDELAQERSVLIEQKEAANREKEAIASDMSELVLLNTALEEKLKQCEAKAESEKSELCQKLAEAEKQVAQQNDRLSEYEKLIAEREVLYTQANKKVEDASKALDEMQAETDALGREVQYLKDEIEALKIDLEKEKRKAAGVQPEKKRRDAVSAILSYVRKR